MTINKMTAKFACLIVITFACACSAFPTKSMLGADGVQRSLQDESVPTYIDDGLVFIWTMKDGEPLDNASLGSVLVEVYNNSDFTLDVCYVNSDESVSGPTMQLFGNANYPIMIGPRNAASTGQTPNPRPNMRYDTTSYFIPFHYTETFRLAMSATISSITRYWNTRTYIEQRERTCIASGFAIYNKNTLGINEIACVLVYNRALSKEEMDYNFMIHNMEFGK